MGAEGITREELLAEVTPFVLNTHPGDGWFSTQEIFDQAQITQPDITLAVVYNNLRRRADKGGVQRQKIGSVVYWKLG